MNTLSKDTLTSIINLRNRLHNEMSNYEVDQELVDELKNTLFLKIVDYIIYAELGKDVSKIENFLGNELYIFTEEEENFINRKTKNIKGETL